jgi:hypothetical protein
MKIECSCGNLIVDSTDYQSNKAHLLADQDYLDLIGAITARIEMLMASIGKAAGEREARQVSERSIQSIHELAGHYMRRSLYQCTERGCLFVDDEKLHLQSFVPENKTVPHNLMRSVKGEKWQRPLRGRWITNATLPQQKSGELWWGFGVGNEGFEHFDSWEALEKRYFEVFQSLKQGDLLRDAQLVRDGEATHQWP